MKFKESRIENYGDHVEYRMNYTLDTLLEDDVFKNIIESLGGYVYNVSVGKIGDVIIFNGITWLSVKTRKSFASSKAWARKFKVKLLNC